MQSFKDLKDQAEQYYQTETYFTKFAGWLNAEKSSYKKLYEAINQNPLNINSIGEVVKIIEEDAKAIFGTKNPYTISDLDTLNQGRKGKTLFSNKQPIS